MFFIEHLLNEAPDCYILPLLLCLLSFSTCQNQSSIQGLVFSWILLIFAQDCLADHYIFSHYLFSVSHFQYIKSNLQFNIKQICHALLIINTHDR